MSAQSHPNHPEAKVHDLLRVASNTELIGDPPPPHWVKAALSAAPWVVVRRARRGEGFIPVGVRGERRRQRWGGWINPVHVEISLRPETLASRRRLVPAARLAEVPAMAALSVIGRDFDRHGLLWGPTGSVGFELASGRATAHADSDLDLMIRCDRALARPLAASIAQAIDLLGVRCDLLLETPAGGVALCDYLGSDASFVLRSVAGPRLVKDPWRGAATPGRGA